MAPGWSLAWPALLQLVDPAQVPGRWSIPLEFPAHHSPDLNIPGQAEASVLSVNPWKEGATPGRGPLSWGKGSAADQAGKGQPRSWAYHGIRRHRGTSRLLDGC